MGKGTPDGTPLTALTNHSTRGYEIFGWLREKGFKDLIGKNLRTSPIRSSATAPKSLGVNARLVE
jgi:hypothetical protein